MSSAADALVAWLTALLGARQVIQIAKRVLKIRNKFKKVFIGGIGRIVNFLVTFHFLTF